MKYKYLLPQECMERYPVIYHDAAQTDKKKKYLVLHEVKDRHSNNWQIEGQWEKYKGIVTWNRKVFVDYKPRYNMIFSPQFQNMFTYKPKSEPWASRKRGLCAVYGPPASVDKAIMCERYDIPLYFKEAGFDVDAFGTMPDKIRWEYREGWRELLVGGLPYQKKNDTVAQYRFGMAFENSRDKYYAHGWVTEKIYDCLASGTIPIYWGAPNIDEFVPPELFIDYRKYPSAQELLRRVWDMTDAEGERMSKRGIEFWESVQFDKYMETFEGLK